MNGAATQIGRDARRRRTDRIGGRPFGPGAGRTAVEAMERRVFLSAGYPDPTFGPGGLGRVTTDFGGTQEEAAVVVPLPDGKFVVAGRTAWEGDVALARYNADGSLDTSFGSGGADGDGKVTTDVGRGDWVAGAAPGPGGTLLVAATQDPFTVTPRETQNFLLLRYTADGSLDRTFGRGGADGDGIVSTHFGDLAEFAFCTGMAVQPDGRIVLAGRLVDTGARTEQVALVRHMPDGTLDRTFGRGGGDGDGRVVAGFGQFAAAGPVAVAPDGRIVVGGSVRTQWDGGSKHLVARFDPDGSTDRTFGGGDGFVDMQPFVWTESVCDLAFVPGGRILALVSSGDRSWVSRLNADGSRDRTFGGDGADPGTTRVDAAAAMAVAADGRITLAGGGAIAADGYSTIPGVAAFRLDPDGHPDPAFGTAGRSIVSLGDPDQTWGGASDVAVLPDGRTLAVGTRFSRAGDIAGTDFFAMRLQADGDDGDGNDQVSEAVPLDFGASTSGQRISPAIDVDLYRVTASAGQRVAFDVDLPAGSALDPYLRLFDDRGNVLAFNDDAAAPGEAVGTEAYVAHRFASAGTYYVGVSSSANSAYDPIGGGRDGAGTPGPYTLTITDRTLPAAGGDLDFIFGADGKTDSAFTRAASSGGVAAMPDGGAVVAGTSNGRFALARYRADGSLDPAFGGGAGVVLTDFGPGAESAAAVLVQPDGRIVVAGTAGGDTPARRMAVARYNPNGTLDARFGRGGADGDGRTAIDFGLPSDGTAVALAPGGKLVVAGNVTRSGEEWSTQNIAVARLNPDGSLDGGFGAGGTAVAPGARNVAAAVAVRPDGRIVVGGTNSWEVDRGTWADYFCLVGYAADGSIDASFGPHDTGVVVTELNPDGGGPAGDRARAMALLPDGRIVLAGAGSAAARYTADGALDPTFDGDGVAFVPLGAPSEGFVAVAPAAGGKLLVGASVRMPLEPSAGEVPGATRSDFRMVRLNADGSVDPTFEGDSRPVSIDFGGEDVLTGIAVGADGRVFAAGTSGGRFAVARLIGDSAGATPATRTYEAEAAAVTGAVATRSHGGYTGTGYVDFQHPSGDSIGWAVDVPSAGDYWLGFRYANGSTGDRPTELRVNGVAVMTGAGGPGLRFPTTASWNKWSTVSVRVRLNAGANAVRLATVGFNGVNVDSLTVHPAPRALEAEAASFAGAGFASDHAGYTGGGYVDYGNAAGDFVEWLLEAPWSGTFTARIRYANGSARDRPLALAVNAAPGSVVAFAPTGSWSSWKTVEVRMDLSAGRNTLRLWGSAAGGPNVDSILVEP